MNFIAIPFVVLAVFIIVYLFKSLNDINRKQRKLIELETAELELEYRGILLDKELIALEPPEMQEAITEEFRFWWIMEQNFSHSYSIPIPFHRPKTEDLIAWGKLRYKLGLSDAKNKNLL